MLRDKEGEMDKKISRMTSQSYLSETVHPASPLIRRDVVEVGEDVGAVILCAVQKFRFVFVHLATFQPGRERGSQLRPKESYQTNL